MDGTPSRPKAPRQEPAPQPPDAARLQAAVDADELAYEQRYARRQEFGALVADAVRRAEAMTRLERLLLAEQPH